MNKTTTDDYRASHLRRGSHYDSLLSSTPFDNYMAEWERRHLVAIVRELYPHGPDRYLDFACGTGRITATVAPLCKASVGVDISPSMLHAAGEKLPATDFRECDLTRDDPDLGVFDLITSFRFFGNAQDELRDGALRAITKRLAPGGHLIINSHRNPHALYVRLARLTGGTAEGMDLHLPKLRQLLHRHGLSIRRLQPIGSWMFRSRMMNTCSADDPAAAAREKRFGHAMFASIAPDTIVVAQRT